MFTRLIELCHSLAKCHITTNNKPITTAVSVVSA